MRIGQAGREVGLHPRTIRYYEEIGLLRPKRSFSPHGNGYRIYGRDDLERLTFIKEARLLGFSLAEVKTALQSIDEGCCEAARPLMTRLLEEKLPEIDRRVQNLQGLRRRLLRLKEQVASRRQTVATPSCKGVTNCAF